MTADIKTIEDLSLNAWPSHQMQVYDGWILRFSHFYTHRTNCVEQIGVSCLPLDSKIAYCEHIYRRWQTPCIFKISPMGDPALDGMLEARGYRIEHHTTVMTADLADVPKTPEVPDLVMENRVSYRWIEGLFHLKQTTNIVHRSIVPNMYAAIPKDEIAVSVIRGDRVIATGLGILDRKYIGLYAIHVDEAFRRQGIARGICGAILAEGRRKGARYAYLQAVSDNAPAKALYRSLGFRKAYYYWFRVREV